MPHGMGTILQPPGGQPHSLRDRSCQSPCYVMRFRGRMHGCQTGSGAQPASWSMGTGGRFPRAKAWPGRDADHSPPSNAEVENE
jgi:hypothetical protein